MTPDSFQKFDLYVDMDGTIAKFYEHANCLERMYEPGFFRTLNAYDNVINALVILKNKGIEICSLSALPDCKCIWVIDEKREWIENTPLKTAIWRQIFTMPGQNKAFATGADFKSGNPKVLLDDYNKNLEEWREAGGVAVKLVNEINDKGTLGPLWSGPRVRYDWPPERIAEEILLTIRNQQTTIPNP